jgi:prophage DNA circulation protein
MATLPPFQQADAPAAAAPTPGWRDRYVKGSFRGVPFVSRDREMTGGRRIALFELPYRDTPIGDDMGRRAEEATIECFVIGADYMAKRDALLAALRAFGPGTYVDPWTGEQLQVYAEDWTLSESTDEGGMARFSILFRESGAEKPLAASVDTAALAKATSADITASLPTDFASRFSVDKAAGFVEEAATDLVERAALVAELSASSSGGLGQALRAFESGLRLLPAGTASMLRAPLALGQSLVGLVATVSALSPNPRTRMRSIEPLARFGAELKPVAPTTPARARQADNQAAIVHLVRAAAGAELVRAAAAITWTNRADAGDVRDRLTELFEGHALSAADAGEDDRAATFDALRAAAVRDIVARSAGLARGYRYTPRVTEPALVIAQRLGGFGGTMEPQAAAIVSMNRVRHPGFVPGGAALDIVAASPTTGGARG